MSNIKEKSIPGCYPGHSNIKYDITIGSVNDEYSVELPTKLDTEKVHTGSDIKDFITKLSSDIAKDAINDNIAKQIIERNELMASPLDDDDYDSLMYHLIMDAEAKSFNTSQERISFIEEYFSLCPGQITVHANKMWRTKFAKYFLGYVHHNFIHYSYGLESDDNEYVGTINLLSGDSVRYPLRSRIEIITRMSLWVHTGEFSISAESVKVESKKYPSTDDQQQAMEEEIVSTFGALCKTSSPELRQKMEILLLASVGFWNENRICRTLTGVAALFNLGLNKSVLELCVIRAYQIMVGDSSLIETATIVEGIKTVQGPKDLYKLISYLIIPFVSEVRFGLAGIDLIAIEAAETASGADLLSAFGSVFKYISHVVEDFQKSGNFKAVFSSDAGYTTFMAKYQEVMLVFEKAKQIPGGLMSTKDNVALAKKIEEEGKMLQPILKDRMARMQVARALHELVKTYADAESRQIEGGQRMKAMAFSIGGDSQVGKTVISDIMFHVMAKAWEVKYRPDGKVTLTGLEKYFPELNSMTQMIQVDDYENNKDDLANSIIVRLINHVACEMEQAEANLKGKCKPSPLGVILNTNVFTLNAEQKTWSIPSALNRLLHMFVTLKPDYINSKGTLDNGKMQREFLMKGKMPDCWDITIYENVCVARSEPYPVKDSPYAPFKHVDQNFYLRPIENPLKEGEEVKNLSFPEVTRIVYELTKKHAAMERLIKTNNDYKFVDEFLDSDSDTAPLSIIEDIPLDEVTVIDHGLLNNLADEVVDIVNKKDPEERCAAREPKGKVFLTAESIANQTNSVVEAVENKLLSSKLKEYTNSSLISTKHLFKRALGFDKGYLIYQRIHLGLIQVAGIVEESCLLHPCSWSPYGKDKTLIVGEATLCNTRHIKTALTAVSVSVINFIFWEVLLSFLLGPFKLFFHVWNDYYKKVSLPTITLQNPTTTTAKTLYIFYMMFSISLFSCISYIVFFETHNNIFSIMYNAYDEDRVRYGKIGAHELAISLLKIAAEVSDMIPFGRRKRKFELIRQFVRTKKIQYGFKVGMIVNKIKNLRIPNLWRKTTEIERVTAKIIEAYNRTDLFEDLISILRAVNVIYLSVYLYDLCFRKFKLAYDQSLQDRLTKIKAVRDIIKTLPTNVKMVLCAFLSWNAVTLGSSAESVKIENKPKEWYMKDTMTLTKDVLPEHNQTIDQVNATLSNNVLCCSCDGIKWQGTMVQSGKMIVPGHVIYQIPKEGVIKAIRLSSGPNATIDLPYSKENCHSHPTVDVGIIEFNSRAAAGFRDITHLFSDTPSTNLKVITKAYKGVGGHYISEVFPSHGYAVRSYKSSYKKNGSKYGSQKLVEYNCPHKNGDCGSPILSMFNKPIILGIHIAGHDMMKVGFGVLVNCDTLRELCNLCDHEAVGFLAPFVGSSSLVSSAKQSVVEHVDSGSFLFFGRQPGYNKQKDDFIEYELKDFFVERGIEMKWTSSKNSMGDHTSRDSKQAWFNKVVTPQSDLKPSLKEMALKDFVEPYIEGKEIVPLTRKELVEGNKEKNVPPLDLSSSLGPPTGGVKKDIMVEKDGKFHFQEDFWEDYVSYKKALMDGYCPKVPVKVGKKMEVRLKGKKQRQFQVFNIYSILAMKEVCGTLFGEFMSNPELSETRVQMNPHGQDWDDMINYFKRVDPERVVCIDYKGFDQSIPSGVFEWVFRSILVILNRRKMVGPSQLLARNLFSYLLNPVIDVDGDIVQVHDVMMSGIFGTSILDGLVTSILLRCHAFELRGPFNFRRFVHLGTVGDDAVFTRSWWYNSINGESYAKFCSKLGMEVTSTTKDGAPQKDLTYKDFSFVSRGCRYDEDLQKYLGPLKKDSIYKSVMCGIKSKVVSPTIVMCDNIDNSLIEMCKYPQSDFKDWKSIIDDIPQAYHKYLRLNKKSYKELQQDLYKFDPLEITAESTPQDGMNYSQEGVLETQDEVVGSQTLTTSVEGVNERSGMENFSDHFVSRPIPLSTITIQNGTNTLYQFDPLAPFFSNKRISNRINNYKNVSCTLCLKAMLPASPFFYGKYIIAVAPVGNNSHLQYGNAGDRYNIITSQLPHITIKPGECETGVLKIPWFCESEMADLISGEPSGLLMCFVRSYTTLQYAGDSVGSEAANIRIIGWLEDVKVQGLTQFDSVYLSAQAEDTDATAKGFVNSIPTALTTAGDRLKHLHGALDKLIDPISQAARLGVQLASIMGYCKPNKLDEDGVVRLRVIGDFSNTNKVSQGRKLTFDPKQTLGIGSLGIDPWGKNNFDFSVISNTQSYLTQFDVTTSDVPGDHLFSMRVTPFTFDRNVYACLFPACAIPPIFFEYWNCDIEITLEPIVNRFHKMCLLVQYDPVTIDDTKEETNVNYSKIIHVEEGTKFSFIITPSQRAPYMLRGLRQTDNSERFSTGPLIPISDRDNGVLSVKVFNSLTAPVQTGFARVPVLVYIRALGEMKVMKPSDEFMGMELTAESIREEMSENLNESSCLATPSKPNDELALMYGGEAITSFKVMLSRYYAYVNIGPPILTNNTSLTHIFQVPGYPLFRGTQPLYTFFGDGDELSNAVWTTPLNMVSLMYGGVRGSLNWRFVVHGSSIPISATMSVEWKEWVNGISLIKYNSSTINNSNVWKINSFPNGATGMDLTQIANGPSIDITVPYQTYKVFSYGRDTSEPFDFNYLRLYLSGVSNADYGIMTFVSGGEDFEVFYFLGLPELNWF